MSRRAQLLLRLFDNPLTAPLSGALVPLALGLLRRSLIRWRIVTAETHRILGAPINVYRAAGRVPGDRELPVLLIHGIADSALTWAATIRPLTQIGPVYAVDMPGYGLSGYLPGRRYATLGDQVAIAQELIRTVIGRPVLAVGNSLGGWTVAKLAAVSPELTAGAVLVDPGGALLDGLASWDPFRMKALVPDMSTAWQINREMFARRWLRWPLIVGWRGLQSIFARDPVRLFMDATTEADALTPAELRGLQVPVALIWGENDSFLPSGSLDYFRKHLPDADLLMVKNCGHLPQRECPLQVARYLRQFAQRARHTAANQRMPGDTPLAPDESHIRNHNRPTSSSARSSRSSSSL